MKIQPEIKFEDRVALITGAGRGIGMTYALELGKRGVKVVVNDPGVDRDGQGGSTTVADQVVNLIRSSGGKATACYSDIRSLAGGEEAIQTAINSYGKIDILVHNAGILRDRSFAKMSAIEWQDVIDVHLNGGFHVTQPAFKNMKTNGYGRIVLTTSVSGLFGNFGQANYGAAKLGLVGLMNVLAIEGESSGIKVNCISPLALTRMTDDIKKDGVSEESRNPAHITSAVTYLCSDNLRETGLILQAGHGFFGRVQVMFNGGVFLGVAPTNVETLAESWEEIIHPPATGYAKSSRDYMAHINQKSRPPVSTDSFSSLTSREV